MLGPIELRCHVTWYDSFIFQIKKQVECCHLVSHCESHQRLFLFVQPTTQFLVLALQILGPLSEGHVFIFLLPHQRI